MGRWRRRKGKKLVWCPKHHGHGPGPLRKWNKYKVCTACYKTLTQFKYVNTIPGSRPPSTTKKSSWGWAVAGALIVIIGAAALF